MSRPEFTHLDEEGRPRMVNVSEKPLSRRSARAEARVILTAEIARQLKESGSIAKGNVIETARIAGIMGAKRTAELIPMCHTLRLDSVELDFKLEDNVLQISAETRCTDKTGVEIEAMTSVSIAALTVYDMCKSADKGIIIESIRLVEKTGGKSGSWSAFKITETGK